MSRRSPDERAGIEFRSRAAGLVHQARRAGRIVIGVRQTRDAIRDGRLNAVLLARDLAGPRREALLERLRGEGVPVYDGWTKDELGELAGRQAVAALGITDRHIASGLLGLAVEGSGGDGERREEVEQSG